MEQKQFSQLDSSKVGALDQDAFELKRMMRQQAHEKSFEISVQSQRYFENEKDKEVERGMNRETIEFEKRINQLNMNSKIEHSKKINESRLRLMKERNECIELVKKATKDRLEAQFGPHDRQYRVTLKNLIVQVSG